MAGLSLPVHEFDHIYWARTSEHFVLVVGAAGPIDGAATADGICVRILLSVAPAAAVRLAQVQGQQGGLVQPGGLRQMMSIQYVPTDTTNTAAILQQQQQQQTAFVATTAPQVTLSCI